MKRILLSLCFLSSLAFGKDTFTEGTTWVTSYLENGGKIENITGLKRPANWKTLAKWNDLKSSEELPSSFNWRDKYKLQPIRNQGQCGSCWAFSVTAVTESLYWVLHNTEDNSKFDLAEQTLVSSCEQGGSCGGGYFSAFDYIKNSGLPPESEDPYIAMNSRCKSGLHPIQKIESWQYVGNQNYGASIEQMKQAIYNYGPVSVDVNGSWGSYSGGVYNRCGSTSTNHMVTLEGWVDDPAYAKNGGGYWILHNSWGENWGEHGFMRIVYKSTGGSKCNGVGNVTAVAVLPGNKSLRQVLKEAGKLR